MLKSKFPAFSHQKVLFLCIPSMHYIIGTVALIHTYWVACLDSNQKNIVSPFGQQFPRLSYQTGNSIVGMCSLLTGMAGCLVVEHQQTNGVPNCYYLLFAFVSGVIVSVSFVLYPAWIGGLAVFVVLFQCIILFIMYKRKYSERQMENVSLRSSMLPTVPEEGEGYV